MSRRSGFRAICMIVVLTSAPAYADEIVLQTEVGQERDRVVHLDE